MESGPITSWQIDGETMETVMAFIFWAQDKETMFGYLISEESKQSLGL